MRRAPRKAIEGHIRSHFQLLLSRLLYPATIVKERFVIDYLKKDRRMPESIYYLPGHGGRLHTGLGEGLLSRGLNVAGRETIGEFKSLPFQAQIETVAEDLSSLYWTEDHRVVCNSFGCYLFLHAQTLMKPYVGKVLLLSPIVGQFSDDESSGLGFIPPRANRLAMLAESGAYPVPKHCEIHVGELDWQSNPANVTYLAGLLGWCVTVVPRGGHRLGKSYVSAVLDKWLAAGGTT